MGKGLAQLPGLKAGEVNGEADLIRKVGTVVADLHLIVAEYQSLGQQPPPLV